jgi:hypothetical protein
VRAFKGRLTIDAETAGRSGSTTITSLSDGTATITLP